jgi:hypothetical protein
MTGNYSSMPKTFDKIANWGHRAAKQILSPYLLESLDLIRIVTPV